ncbi:transcriptional regulator [Bifidobacterium goeldii]|uniref:Transcriptional regulator n=1 Tax=Bifidobacterium goeldii TaxID=2306975 RepID=A0A430FM21_9BIFI|nr:helix-turn-helix domain-containing protein [Bifidobacterium goeldii]RSX53830.1 transcriptional regulator [Bifidobacterium goeldii]
MANIAVRVNSDYLEDVQYDDPTLPIHFCMDYFDTLAGHEINVHWHRDFEFAIMLRGACNYHLGGGDAIRLEQGDGIFVNSEALHSADNPTPGAIMSCVTFSPLFFTGQPSGTIYSEHILPVVNRPLAGLRLDASRNRDMLAEILTVTSIGKRETTAPLEYVEHVARLWRLTLSAIDKVPDERPDEMELLRERRIRTMMTFIQRHFDAGIGLPDIAASAGIGRTECFRLFTRLAGVSPGEYLISYRLRRAAAMLVSGDDSVALIAHVCGFNDASYFAKRFRQRYGCTPREYRAVAGRVSRRSVLPE